QLRCQRNRLEYLDITGFRITPSHSTRHRFEIYYGNYEEEQHLKTLKVNEVLRDDYEIDEVKTSSPEATVHVYNDQGEETCTDYDFSADYDTDAAAVGKCRDRLVDIPDDNLKRTLQERFKRAFSIRGRITDQMDPDDPIVRTTEQLDVSRKNIKSLSGIESFKALQHLNCSENILTTLNMSENHQLKELSCLSNYLTHLDVSKNNALQILDCRINHLSRLDLSQNTELKKLWCYHNELNYLDVTGFRYAYDDDDYNQRDKPLEIYYDSNEQGYRLRILKINKALKDYREIKEIKRKTPKVTVAVYNNNGDTLCSNYTFRYCPRCAAHTYDYEWAPQGHCD
ncbi:MAG: hypothetical protein V6Z82_04080, partial [Flavobacteriales bacterium]